MVSLWKEQKKWARLSQILGQEGADAKTLVFLQVGGPSGATVLIEYMSYEPMHWKEFGGIS